MKKLGTLLMACTLTLFTACSGGGNSNSSGPASGDVSNPSSESSQQSEPTEQPAGGETIGDSSGAEIFITLCDSQPESSLIGQAEKQFGQYLLEASNGRIALKYYPSAMLGDGTTCMQQVQLGSLDMYRCDAAVLYDWGVDSMKIPGLPYLFESQQHGYEVVTSEIGQKWLQDVTDLDNGMVGIGYLVDMPRCIFTVDTPITTLEEANGVKVRSLEGAVFMDFKSSLGMSPVPMAWSEVYTSLSTGVLDAATNTLDSFVSNKMNEVCKYFVNNNGMFLVCPMVFSETTWSNLSAEDQQIVIDCWDRASKWYVVQSEGVIEKEVAEMEAAGIVFCDLEDMDQWIEASQPVVDKYSEGYEDIVAEIRGQWLDQ